MTTRHRPMLFLLTVLLSCGTSGDPPSVLESPVGLPNSVVISRGNISIGVVETRATNNNLGRQRHNDSTDPQVLDLARFNFSGFNVLNTIVLTPACAHGFAATELGPSLDDRAQLDWLRVVRGLNCQRYLDQAAEKVLAVVQHWSSVHAQAPKPVHLFYEPTPGSTEIFSSTTQEVKDLFARVGTRLRSAGISETRFIVPNVETMDRSLAAEFAIPANTAAGMFVGAIGFHQYPYGSASVSPRRVLISSGAGLPDPATRNEPAQPRALGAIEHVLARVVHVHDVLVYGGASASFRMHTIWDASTYDQHFAGCLAPFLADETAIVLEDQHQNRIRTTSVGYGIGHYGRLMDSTRWQTFQPPVRRDGTVSYTVAASSVTTVVNSIC